MTEAELNQYRAIQTEIDDLNFRIGQLSEKKVQVMTDKVKGSTKYFPYTEVNFNVTGVDQAGYWKNQNRINKLKHKREDKKAELIQKESEMYDFIYSIQDSLIRQIFILRFIDGLPYESIGKRLHMDRTTVAKKITKYLEQ